MNYSEAELVQALAEGKDDAFRFAIKSYQSSMLGLARSLVGEKIADEVVQEAWLSVYKAVARFEGRSTLKTWLLRIVANEAKTRLRKENRQTSLDALLAIDPHFADRFDDTGHWSPLPNQWHEDSPDALITTEDLKACMKQMIAVLPDMQAAALNLKEMQNYSLKEICNILEISESNVRVVLHRARQRLYRCIEHFQETGDCCTTLEQG